MSKNTCRPAAATPRMRRDVEMGPSLTRTGGSVCPDGKWNASLERHSSGPAFRMQDNDLQTITIETERNYDRVLG